MRSAVCVFAALLLVFGIVACGSKGGLKSPSQIAQQEAREAHKNAKTQPTPTPTPTPAPPSAAPAALKPVQNPTGDQPPEPSTGSP